MSNPSTDISVLEARQCLATVLLTIISSDTMQPLLKNVEAFAQPHALWRGSCNTSVVARLPKQEFFFSIPKALKQQKFNTSHSQLRPLKINKRTWSHPYWWYMLATTAERLGLISTQKHPHIQQTHMIIWMCACVTGQMFLFFSFF